MEITSTKQDRKFMQIAIDMAQECVSEHGRESPKVGAVVVKDGKILAKAYRGQIKLGEHAEFTALEKMLTHNIIAGATVYTTLEPCTTRNHPKVHCAQRLIDRKIARVVIGMLDPDSRICGKGVRKLRDANIETVLFPYDLARQVEDQNRRFRVFVEEREPFIETKPFPVQDWRRRLNLFFDGRVEISAILTSEPKVVIGDSIPLTEDQERVAKRFRRELKINDPVAILTSEPVWTDNPVVLHVETSDYAAVCAIEGHKPMLLSSDVLLFCSDTQELILQRRSAKVSRDHGGALHTFGGAYMPPNVDARDYDHLSLLRAARREVEEESGIGIDITRLPTMLMLKEADIGFLQFALVGIDVSREAVELGSGNAEGEITRIRSSELLARLTAQEVWVASGKALVLAWLALSAPHAKRPIRFGDLSAHEVFNNIVP